MIFCLDYQHSEEVGLLASFKMIFLFLFNDVTEFLHLAGSINYSHGITVLTQIITVLVPGDFFTMTPELS
jgi:hypothetical protein